jgi:Zn-dependent peptidase ImmA (M78 family)
MLQLARELRGWTQARLASESGVTQAYVSLLEHGQKDASDDKAAKLSGALGFPESFFRQDERYAGFGLSLVFHRRKSSARIGHLRRLQAEVNLRRIHVTRLLRGVNILTDNEFQFMDVDEHDGDATKIAAFVRANWRLPLGPITDLVKAIENAGGVVFRFPFGTKDIDAISHWPVECPPLFFVNADAPADRIRFSLSHELGHVTMHRGASDAMEDEADRFASEFLMPARQIAPQLNGITIRKAAKLKPYWRASMQALIRRARDLGRITATEYSRLFRRLSSLGYRKSEPVEIAPEVPRLFDRILKEYQTANHCTSEDMAAILHVTEEQFLSMYGPAGQQLRIARE